MRTPDELAGTFREQGLKVTPQRQLLFRLLHGNASHPTADALFAEASGQMPGISLRTVYQTLTDLVAMGEVATVAVGGATRFDPNVDPHHHARCQRCGDVRDVYVDHLDRLPVRGCDGFVADGATIVFSGVCAPCAAAGSSSHQPINQGATPA